MIETNTNRETWLLKATNQLQEKVFTPVNLTIPHDVKISCGFAIGSRAGAKKMTLGVCHPRSHSKDLINEIFMSPQIDDSLQTLGTLAHELIHAIDDCKNGHKKAFRDMAHAIGLTGQMRSTTETPELVEILNTIVSDLGEYPHAKIILNARKKQSTRNIKFECTDDDGNGCGFSFRTSQKNADMIQVVTCPACVSETSFLSRA
jgi:hypothetical protein